MIYRHLVFRRYQIIDGRLQKARLAIFLILAGGAIACGTSPSPNNMIFSDSKQDASWKELGESGSGSGVSGPADEGNEICLALDEMGMPIMAWSDRSQANVRRVRARKWTGNRWSAFGIAAQNDKVPGSVDGTFQPSLLHRGQETFIAHVEESDTYSVHLQSHDGTDWKSLGTLPLAGATIVDNLSIAVTRQHGLVVACRAMRDRAYGPRVYVQKNNQWDVQDIPVQAGWFLSTISRISFTAKGELFLAWEEHREVKTRIMVHRLEKAGWQPYAGGIALECDAPGVEKLSLTSSDDMVCFAAEISSHDKVISTLLISSKGTRWEPILREKGAARCAAPHVCLDAKGRLLVAYTGSIRGKSRVYVEMWDGNRWELLRGGNEDDQGDAAEAQMHLPQIASASDGTIYLAWLNQIGKDTCVRLLFRR